MNGAAAAPEVGADASLRLVLPARVVPAGEGWSWIKQGWRLFTAAPLMWIISIVALFVIALVTNFIPILGGILFQLLQAVFAAGFIAACRSLEGGEEFEIEHLFAGFTRQFVNLVILGAIVMLGWIVILVVFAAFVGFTALGGLIAGDAEAIAHSMAASIGMILVGLLVSLLLMVPLLMAYWFAPALVYMHGVAPIAALKASFGACLRNLMPFLVYGLVMTVFGFLAVIPLGLGILVWWPLAIASSYAAYRALFTDDAPPTVRVPVAQGMID